MGIGAAIGGILQGWQTDSNELNTKSIDGANKLNAQATASSAASKFAPTGGPNAKDPDVAKLDAAPAGSVTTESSYSPALPQGQRLSDILGTKSQNPSPSPQGPAGDMAPKPPSGDLGMGMQDTAAGGSPGVSTQSAPNSLGGAAAKPSGSGISSGDVNNYAQVATSLGSLLKGPEAPGAQIPQAGNTSGYTPTATAQMAPPTQAGGGSLQDAMRQYQLMQAGQGQGGGGMI